MHVIYVTRSFLDYRVPIFEAMSTKLGGGFHVIYSADYVPERVHERAKAALGDRAIGMRRERRIGPREIVALHTSDHAAEAILDACRVATGEKH